MPIQALPCPAPLGRVLSLTHPRSQVGLTPLPDSAGKHMTQAGLASDRCLFLAQLFVKNVACQPIQKETYRDFPPTPENQGKGPLFTEIDYRDSGCPELWEAILLTMQDGNLHEGHQHRGTWSPEIKKRDGFLKAFFGPLDSAVSCTGIARRVTFKLLS